MVRFTESAIAQDKWDILNRLMKLGDHPLDEKAVASLMEKLRPIVFPFSMKFPHGTLIVP